MSEENSEVKKENKIGNESRFGFFVYYKCCQCFNSMNWFVFFLFMIIAANGFGVNGALLAGISTIEKRFGFSSKQSGLIIASYDIGYLLFAFPFGWLAKKVSLGASLGPAGAAIATGAALYFLPHFGTPNAPVLGSEDYEPNLCELTKETGSATSRESESNWLVCFIIAGILTGMGNSVLWTRGATAAEDQTNERKGGVNMSILNGGSVAGPLLGLFISVFVLGLWTDLSEHSSVDLEPSDPNWIGAWWLPFLIQFFFASFAFPFLFGFPKVLPEAPERKRSEKTDFSSEFAASKVVLKNACWWFCSIGAICDTFTIAALMGYGMKFLQETFSVSASVAGLCGGLCALGGLIGCLIPIPFGTFKLPSYKLLIICFLTSVSCLVVYLPSLYRFPCENQHIFGVFDEHGNPLDNPTLQSCSSSCQSCSMDTFEPVCDEQSSTIYFSPCHAGCQDANLTTCFCDGSSRKELTEGLCDNSSECDSLWKITICFMFVFAFLYVPLPLVPTAFLRQFKSDEKPTATSLNLILNRLLGAIPAPIVVGAIIDDACVVWSENDDGSQKNCLIYDNRGLVRAFTIMPLTMKAAAGVCYLFAAFFARKQDLIRISDEKNDLKESPEKSHERLSTEESSF